MPRLASIGARTVHQPLTLAIYTQLQANTDWDYVPGADIAGVTGGNTITVTSRHHKVTISGGTIDNISDAAGATAGQLLELYFTAANTIRNQGGGTGNIRSISGTDLAIAAGDIVELVYDGTNWRECSRANLNLPNAGKVQWGTDANANLYRLSAGNLQTDGAFWVGGAAVVGAGGSNPFLYLGPALDAYMSRVAAGEVALNSKLLEGLPAAGTVTVPATFTPNLATGLTQRCNVTAGGANTLTIAAPTNPPSSTQTALMVIRISNTGGGTITLAWNGAFIAGPTQALPANIANGAKSTAMFVWDGANWQLMCVG